MSRQRTPEWMAKRAGCFTASRSGDLMAKTKSGPSTSRAKLLSRLAVERINGYCMETFTNGAMQRGVELEPEARAAYSFEVGVAVEEIDYVEHPEMPLVGCSPDGVVGADGLVELKCPASEEKHMEALTRGAHCDEYRWQLQHQLFVTGRQWVDMVSYDPRFPPGLQLAVKRVFRDAEAIEELKAEITKAEVEVETIVARLRELQQRTAA